MKKVIVVLSLLLVTGLAASDWLQPGQTSRYFDFKGRMAVNQPVSLRDQDPPPAYDFVTNGAGDYTTYLYDSYYDYMPFSYNGTNVRYQPEMSLPYGYAADGLYISYHCSETPTVNQDRRAWYSYLNPDWTLQISGATNQYAVIREGFTTVDIDPITGDPFFAWHSIVETDNIFDCSMTYDNFHLSGSSGLWKQPFILIDNPELTENMTGADNDEFNWPIMMIGDAPLETQRRLHAYATNSTANAAGHWGYNFVYAYADFEADSLLLESELTWHYRTFPYFDHIHNEDITRVNKDMLVRENMVAFFGSYADTLFCMLSEDYGENFTWYRQEWIYPVENPLQQDGVTYEFYNNDGVTPAELFFVLSNDGSHYNGVWADQLNRIMWFTGINMNSQENIDQDLYWAAYFYPKIFSFDLTTHTFAFVDVDLLGVDPYDDQPAIPWDLDEDGEVDEYYSDGSVYIPLSMASWFFNTDQGYQDSFFDEASFRMTANDQYVVAAWQDCKKARWAYFGEDGYDGWVKQPEIAIIVSRDAGLTWSDPLYINANPNDAVIDPDNHYEGNYAPELEGMLPVNIALCDRLDVLGSSENPTLRMYMAFFDDNDYGAAAGPSQSSGDLNGGKCRFTVIDLQPLTGADDQACPPQNISLAQNYPNPFNPVTTISFQLPAECQKAELTIYNIKGQLIRKYLMNPSTHEPMNSVIWDGRDEQNQQVGSGMYFYKLKTENESQTRKMIMMK